MRQTIVLITMLAALQLAGPSAYSQLKDYSIGPHGDTLNGVDQQNRKQGKWVDHVDELRGEPGYEEE